MSHAPFQTGGPVEVRTHAFTFKHRRGVYTVVKVDAGLLGTERIVPPAGEEHAFKVDLWQHRVEVSVSPSGRSVRVWLDGKELT